MSNLSVYNGPRIDPAPFAEWAARHSRIFYLSTDGDRATLGDWCKIFALHGFTAAELEEATTWLAGNAPPTRRADHLIALENRVKDQRRLLASRRPAYDRGVCETCGNTALVAVPGDGMRTPNGNVYPAGTDVVVKCKCVLGRMSSIQTRSLDEYEKDHPFWKDEMDRRRELAKLRANAMSGSRMMDQTLGSILKRLRDREAGAGI